MVSALHSTISKLRKLKKIFPLIDRFISINFCLKPAWFQETKFIPLKKTDGKGVMNYPLNPLQCSGGDGYNIVFLIVDSLRYDMVDETIMPNVSAFSKNAINFKDHYSGGINTRHGLFSAAFPDPIGIIQRPLNPVLP